MRYETVATSKVSNIGTVKVNPISVADIEFRIVGVSPIIMHGWSEKSTRMLRMTAAERRKEPKVARDPEAEAFAAAYRTPTGEYGIPAVALKASIINAAHKDLGLEKTLVRKSFFLAGKSSGGYENQIIPFDTNAEPIVREDMVRVGAGASDLRYRLEFGQWSAIVRCTLDISALSPKDLANLINRAGFGVGLCEWRPEKGGEYGRFQVDKNFGIQSVDTYVFGEAA